MTLNASENLASKNTNTIRWSPKGRHVVLTTMGNSNHFTLEFWDLDFVTDDRRTAEEREAGVGIQLLSGSGVEHYGITDLEWDPSGRYVASSASAWRHSVRTIPSTFQRRALSMFAHFRLKTALLFGIGAVLSWRSTSLINLNNSCGALDRVPFFRRKGRR